MMPSKQRISMNSHEMDAYTKYSFKNTASGSDESIRGRNNGCSPNPNGGFVGRSFMIPDTRSPKGKGKKHTCSQRHYVQHDYHDHARDHSVDSLKEPSLEVLKGSELSTEGPLKNDGSRARSKKSKGGPRGGVVTPFPEKLHQMLENVEQEGFTDIISWQPHGRCFVMHKPKEFVKVLMPRYFRQTKLTSFQRQLNLYGFCRLTSGVDKCGYYHELFLRGKPSLCRKMMRIRIKGTSIKAASNPETEPNFYLMPKIQPDDSSNVNALAPISEDESQTTNNTCPGEMIATISCASSVESHSDFKISTKEIASPSTIPKSVSPSPDSPTSFVARETISLLPPLPLYFPPSSENNNTVKLDLPFQSKFSAPIIDQDSLQNNSEAISFGGKKFHYLDSFVHCDYSRSDDLFDAGDRLGHPNLTFPSRRRSVTFDSALELHTPNSPTRTDSVASFPTDYSKSDEEEYEDPVLSVDFFDLVGITVDMNENRF